MVRTGRRCNVGLCRHGLSPRHVYSPTTGTAQFGPDTPIWQASILVHMANRDHSALVVSAIMAIAILQNLLILPSNPHLTFTHNNHRY